MGSRRRTVSIPAPVGGWNTRDPISSMAAIYAPVLDNVFCLPSEIQVRKGYSRWAHTFTGNCETVMAYNAASGTEKLLAAVNNAGACAIYDVSSSGAVGAAVVSGLTSARFRHINFATSGGYFGYFVNGADSARLFDGTVWTTITGASTPAITGPANTYFIDVIAHKRRLWFVLGNSMSGWYLPTDSIGGAATEFSFAPIFPRGGKIVKLDTWSLDAGTGLDDYLVVFTSEGEVAVYQGTDPASANTWSLQGVFYIGEPIGPVGRTSKYGGDVLILNRDGIANLSESLMSSRVTTEIPLGDKIQPTISSDVSAYASIYGWDLCLYPTEGMLMINVPITSSTSYQYVMNTTSGAWARWTGIPAKCLFFANDRLYFGANGYVGRMWDTQNDNGSLITADILPAYQNFGNQSQLKRWPMARVVLGANGRCAYGIRMEVDFNLTPGPVTLPSFTETNSAIYDTDVYDASYYGGALQIEAKWRNTSGIGYWGSPHTQVRKKYTDVRIYSYDVVIEQGGTI